MPINHSVGGAWHSGHKEYCVKCGYVPPAPKPEPVAVATPPETEPAATPKPKKPRKKKVT